MVDGAGKERTSSTLHICRSGCLSHHQILPPEPPDHVTNCRKTKDARSPDLVYIRDQQAAPVSIAYESRQAFRPTPPARDDTPAGSSLRLKRAVSGKVIRTMQRDRWDGRSQGGRHSFQPSPRTIDHPSTLFFVFHQHELCKSQSSCAVFVRCVLPPC